ncbi:universal stress protein [Nonomuraea guangzhouensis]|uniref:Universal stress protein n=1 Tax=Nonomuraea guangzhouensis TaxID=1291555 RepID=A0ABW4GUR7_9ACTN|nr:universal stress protein [Nonomuraea guangzhouensis]
MSDLIVVGVDGSVPGFDAVAWAADDAFRMRVPLRSVCVVETWAYRVSQTPSPEWDEVLIENARKVLAEAEELARERQPTVEVSTEVIKGTPAAAVLREQAGDAIELVVGSRGLGGFAGAMLGSVSMNVAGQVPVPVVVVRPRAAVKHGEIVVGLDGSPACEPALAYAFRQAELRGSTLRAVYAWALPFALAAGFSCDFEALREAQQGVAKEQLTPWRERYPNVKVIADVRCAHPVDALAAAGDRADLLVVGSHGRTAIGSIILGSVSRGVLHHAHCTVAVVRANDAPTPG